MPVCWIVNVCPATVIVAERVPALTLGATKYVTAPLPVPLLPEATLTKLWLLAAVQLHPLAAVTLTVPLPPVELKL